MVVRYDMFNSDVKKWKIVEIQNPHLFIPDEDPELRYDHIHNEIINIHTGEVIKG